MIQLVWSNTVSGSEWHTEGAFCPVYKESAVKEYTVSHRVNEVFWFPVKYLSVNWQRVNSELMTPVVWVQLIQGQCVGFWSDAATNNVFIIC